MNMARRLVLAGVIMMCLLTACSVSNRGFAVVRGYMVWPLGRLPQQLRPESATGLARVLRDGHVVAEVTVGRTGRFTVEVPPGTYTLTGLPSNEFRGNGACSAGHVVHARSGEVISVNVDCHLVGIAPG
jgi:hypothetical protein